MDFIIVRIVEFYVILNLISFLLIEALDSVHDSVQTI